MRLPDSLARLNTGRSMDARIAMMAMTTSNSINVKAGGAQKRFSRLAVRRRFVIFITV